MFIEDVAFALQDVDTTSKTVSNTKAKRKIIRDNSYFAKKKT